jgi:predicted PurR-regulated permease PerM
MVARVTLTIVLVALALWTASDFLSAFGWAAILAITMWPVYCRCVPFLGASRSPILAPMLFTLLAGVILFVPLALAAHEIARQGGAVFSWIEQARQNGIPVPGWVPELPIAAEMIQDWWKQNLSDPKTAAIWFQSINAENTAQWARTVGSKVLHRAFMFLV